MGWTRELAVALEAGGDAPVFLQISRAIAQDIRRGRLRPGDPLPGSRTLSRTLQVHRNTVLAAYQELEAEGWISTRPARGTFVSAALPELAPAPFAASRARIPAATGFPLPPPLAPYVAPTVPRGTLSLGAAVPDPRLIPLGALARAYRRALRVHGRTVLDYGDPRGHARLRRALAEMLSRVRGLAATEDALVVTRGSQMAIDLVSRALLAPGDVVAVEAFGYRPAWGAMRLAGATLVPIPVDAAGLQVDALAALCRKKKVRAVYLTPHHQYPTTVGLSAGRRLELLALARTHRLALLEDDYDHEFHYEGRPILPLASADAEGHVVYIGTLSKILAPGLRLGFVVAPPPLLDRVAALRVMADRHGDQVVECAVAELLEDGEVQRHARRMKRIYQARRDALAEALTAKLGDAVRFTLPPGGMAIWGELPGIDVDAWAERALQRKVALFPASRFHFSGEKSSHARLGFASLDEDELREAVRRLAAALKG